MYQRTAQDVRLFRGVWLSPFLQALNYFNSSMDKQLHESSLWVEWNYISKLQRWSRWMLSTGR